jgi:hypothetical protein
MDNAPNQQPGNNDGDPPNIPQLDISGQNDPMQNPDPNAAPNVNPDPNIAPNVNPVPGIPPPGVQNLPVPPHPNPVQPALNANQQQADTIAAAQAAAQAFQQAAANFAAAQANVAQQQPQIPPVFVQQALPGQVPLPLAVLKFNH